MSSNINQKICHVWRILRLTIKRFYQIDGAQNAGAFAYYAFFSLFPLIILIVTLASTIMDRDIAAAEVIGYIQRYVALGEEAKQQIFLNITNVIETRSEAGVIASLMLLWAASQFFLTVTAVTNRAWGIEKYNWWRLPVKGLGLLGVTVITVLVGIAVPFLSRLARIWILPMYTGHILYDAGIFSVSLAIVFICLVIFYRFAPHRPVEFRDVWIAALFVTVLFKVCEHLFVIYLSRFSLLNAIYGTAGGIMALLLWIYLTGTIFILGACLSAVQTEVKAETENKNG